MNNPIKSFQKEAYQVFHINVFTQKKYSGNSATVVWRSNELCEQQMQLLAREFNTPESIFVSLVNDDLFVRFFTPTQEVSSCGHGTIAAAYVAKKMLGNILPSLVFNTVKGNIKVNEIDEKYPEFKFEALVPIIEACIEIPKNITDTLTKSNIDFMEAYIVNTGLGKNRLLLRCKNVSQLLSLCPNFSLLLIGLSRLNLCSIFVFSLDNKKCSKVSGRMFAPNIGINEDPVNGNSSVALACVIYHLCKRNEIQCPTKFDVYQGKAVNREGKTSIHLHYDANAIRKVELSGTAVELFTYNSS